jgi:AraC-like DNA-binding protein
MLVNLILGALTFIMLLFCVKLFFTSSESRYINVVFGFAIFGRCGLNIVYILSETGHIVEYPYLLKALNPLYYSIPSFLFIYFRGILFGQIKFTKMDIIHFLPFVYGFIDVFVYFIDFDLLLGEVESMATKDKYLYCYVSGPISSYFLHGIRPLFFLIYLIAIVRISYLNNDLKIGFKMNKRQKWVSFLVSMAIITLVLQLAQWYNNYWGDSVGVYASGETNSFVVFPLMLLFILLLFILNNPNVLYGNLYILKEWQKKWEHSQLEVSNSVLSSKEEFVEVVLKEDTENEPENKELIPQSLAMEYAQLMLTKLKEDKGYLKLDYQISDLSTETNFPVYLCSFVLNNVIKKNFRDWINEFRINYFIELYIINKNKKTIEALAQESGFKNPATFYNAFKKLTGLSPSQYFKNRG